MFITEAIAATETATGATPNPAVGLLVQLVLVFCIFYIILIRPQQKRMKEHEDMLNSIKARDEVITGGGVYGKVVATEEKTLTIEISKGVEVKVSRSSIKEVVSNK